MTPARYYDSETKMWGRVFLVGITAIASVALLGLALIAVAVRGV